MFDWEDFRHFLALSRAGTLAGAARELGVDHATVGRRVDALEASLGLSLVRRQARRCVLTEAGRSVAAAGERLDEGSLAVSRLAAALGSAPEQRVTVSAPPALTTRVLAPLAGALLKRHPSLRLVLLGETRAASLTRQEADVAVRLSRPTEPGYVARRAGTMRFALYAAPGYADRPAEEWRFIAHESGRLSLPQDEMLRRVARGRPVVLETNDLSSQAAAAASGLGVAALPSFLADTTPGLAEVALPGSELMREMWLAVHADLRRSGPVRMVMDFLLDSLAPVRRE